MEEGETAPIQAIAYSAADGLQIPAYLTLPRGVPAKALPLVVFPHGGPADRDEYGFDWWAQAMASRGYAVLQPEFRGSDGYGWDFLSAGFGEWGRKMQTDLSDGVRALAAQGTIDPKRVCIVGASYGGYAALAGATLDTGVYRCAASIAGISGLHDFLRWRESRDNSDDDTTTRYWLRFLGAASDDDPVLDQLSPIKHVDMVTIPILLIHGKDDTVVPIDQSEDMADALKDAKKDVTLVELEDEDHWLSRARTREQMLETLMDFLGKNNPP
jgi:dipeptidyl aminopeptidase/acylaminoacyl peptidase